MLQDWNMKGEIEQYGSTSGEESGGGFGGAQG